MTCVRYLLAWPALAVRAAQLGAACCALLLFSQALADTDLPPDMSLYEKAQAYEHGEGVAHDAEKAARLYCEAARRDDAEAMFALGWMYANGRGLERDDAAAAHLFARAAEHGHEHAERMLRYTGQAQREPQCLSQGLRVSGELSESLTARLQRLPESRRQVVELIEQWAPQYQVSPELALAIALTESALNPAAVSHKNAQGVMQLIPATAERFQVADSFDPEQNIRGGLAYLQWLLAYFEGNVLYAAAAYNAGERAVERHGGVPPYDETRAYVRRITNLFRADYHPYDASVTAPSPRLQVAERSAAR